LDIQQRRRAKGFKQLDYEELYEILKKFTAYLKYVDAKKGKDYSQPSKYSFHLLDVRGVGTPRSTYYKNRHTLDLDYPEY